MANRKYIKLKLGVDLNCNLEGKFMNYITVIGGGLAGSEAAYQIAKRGIKVKLYEMKPIKFFSLFYKGFFRV